MGKIIKLIISAVLGVFCLAFGICTKLTPFALLIFVGLKVFYQPYTLGWLATIIIPIGGGVVSWFLTLITALISKKMALELE